MRVGRLLRMLAHTAPSQIWHRARIAAQSAWIERLGPRVDARYRSRAAELGPARWDHPGLARVAELRCGRSCPDASLAGWQ